MSRNFISITMDPLRVAAVQQELAELPGAAEKALASAINDAAARGKTAIVRSLADTITAKQKIIRTAVRITEKAKPGKLSALLRVVGKTLGLLQFKTKFNKRRGVTAEIFRGVQVNLPEAFIGIGPRGSKHVLSRAGGKTKIRQAHYKPNVGKVRQNVLTRKGTDLVSVVETKPESLQQPLEVIQDAVLKRTASQLDRFLERRKV